MDLGHEKSPSDVRDSLATVEEHGEGLGIVELQGRLERYAGGKARALRISEYISKMAKNPKIAQFMPENCAILLADEVRNCASYLVFKNYFQIDEVRLFAFKSCRKHLLCPFCAMRRASKYLQKYLEKVEELEVAQVITKRLKPYFVTLTVKNTETLEQGFTLLKTSFARYLEMRRNALKGQKSCEFGKAEGGVYSYEIKRGKNSGFWHPHLHSIWWCEEQPDQNNLSKEWHNITGNSFVVDVRELKGRDGQNSLVAGFIEVFKYALKFSDMTEKDTFKAYCYLKGAKLIGSFGFLYGVKVSDELEDEPLNLPYWELFYQYLEEEKFYRLEEVTYRDGSQESALLESDTFQQC